MSKTWMSLFLLMAVISFDVCAKEVQGGKEVGNLFQEQNRGRADQIVDDFLAKAEKFVPAAGFVLDEQTAIEIAQAILKPIYGSKIIEEEKPYKARLKGNVWIVSGSGQKFGKDLMLGGVSYIKISKKNGSILLVTHGQ